MQQINAKNVHPVYGDGIRTHKLLIESPPLTTRPFSMLLIYLFVPEKLYSNKFSFWMKCQKFFSTFLSTCTYWQTLYQLFGAWKNFQERERERERKKERIEFQDFFEGSKVKMIWFRNVVSDKEASSSLLSLSSPVWPDWVIFYIFLGTKFFAKVAQMCSNIFGILWRTAPFTFYVTFWATFGENWATFYSNILSQCLWRRKNGLQRQSSR